MSSPLRGLWKISQLLEFTTNTTFRQTKLCHETNRLSLLSIKDISGGKVLDCRKGAVEISRRGRHQHLVTRKSSIHFPISFK